MNKILKLSFSLATLAILTVSASADIKIGGCLGCHGQDFEKKALGKSLIVKDMNQSNIANALKGYKDGSYGGPMKGIMKGQVAKYSNENLNDIAKMIQPETKTLKKEVESKIDVKIGGCLSCHGQDFEKKALGKSLIVKDMTIKQINDALQGYKDGSYGGPMKGIMKGQVAKYSDKELAQIAIMIKSEIEEDTN